LLVEWLAQSSVQSFNSQYFRQARRTWLNAGLTKLLLQRGTRERLVSLRQVLPPASHRLLASAQ
jgi:hypothetical protein